MKKSFNFWKLIALGGITLLTTSALQGAAPRTTTPHTAPRLSPVGQAAQVIGVTGVSVTYSRPAVKDRKIWGEVVPWDEVWRTGANDPTTITFSSDVRVEGQKLPAGTYALFTIPEKNEWTVIFNKNHKQWGAFSYSQDDDVLRVKVKARKAAHQELLTIDFPEVSDQQATMRLRWGKVAVPVTLRTELDREALLHTARQAAAIEGGINHLWEWVAYLVQEDITTPEMTQWTDRIIEAYPGYYATQLKAQVLAKMGKTQDAISTAKQALEMGEKELGTNQFLTREQLEKFSSDVDGWRAGAE